MKKIFLLFLSISLFCSERYKPLTTQMRNKLESAIAQWLMDHPQIAQQLKQRLAEKKHDQKHR